MTMAAMTASAMAAHPLVMAPLIIQLVPVIGQNQRRDGARTVQRREDHRGGSGRVVFSSAPCIGRVTAEQHRKIVLDFCDFLSGKTDRLARELEQQMNAASAELDFERAARLRDDIAALKRALEKQAVVLGDGTDADVVAFADDDLEAAVQVFHVRGGRVRGQRGWVVEKPGEPGESAQGQLVEQFLTQFYGDQAQLDGGADESSNPVPREVLVPCLPDNAEELVTWLSALRGSKVALRVPQRGDKRVLAETVQRNAQEALQQHKLKRAGDFTARSAALQNIQESLGLADAPLPVQQYCAT